MHQPVEARDCKIGHLFLVGGFAESAIVQEAIRAEFGQAMNVIIPQVSGKGCVTIIEIVAHWATLVFIFALLDAFAIFLEFIFPAFTKVSIDKYWTKA